MKQIGKLVIKSSVLLFCAAMINPGSALAQTSAGFSVRAIIPDNQIDKRQTYFDLRMQPGEEQTLEFVIDNSLDEEFSATVQLNAASTGRNGSIVYTVPDVRDKIMDVSITDIAALQTESVTVPANGSRTVTINIKMPDKPIEGVILGGIAVSGADDINDDAQMTQGASLSNKITYVIALKLTESDIETQADFDLASIKPELVNFKTSVVATMQNKSARIIKGMEVKAQVFRKGSDTVINELELGDVEMAPLSNGDFVVDWQNKPLDRGTYRLKMTAKYEGKTWEWDKEFTIGSGESADLNNAAVGLIKDYTWLYILAGAGILTVVWFAAYRSGKRGKPNERAQQQYNR